MAVIQRGIIICIALRKIRPNRFEVEQNQFTHAPFPRFSASTKS
jgi:hypothetical protein